MAFTKPILLVVEDELPLLQAILHKASGIGFDVVTARSVDEAIHYLTDLATIDAIWVDHFLPAKEGIELLRHLRRDSRWNATPVFLVTNVIEADIVNEYIKLGISGYYTKMLMSLDDIVTKIRNIVFQVPTA